MYDENTFCKYIIAKIHSKRGSCGTWKHEYLTFNE